MSLFANLMQGKPAQTPSLFGSNPASSQAAQTSQASSLFASTAATSQPAAGGLFGTAASQPQTGAAGSGSLFGNIGAAQPTSTAPQTGGNAFGSLLGGNQAQQQSTASSGAGILGGAVSTSQPQASTTTSLFAGLGKSQAPSQASSGPSLFGGLSSTSQPGQTQGLGGGSLMGSLQQPKPAASGLFGSTLGQSAASNSLQQPAQAPAAQVQQPGKANAQPAYFDHLLERGRKRNKRENENGNVGDLPSLQLGLGDIARKVRSLGTGSSAAADTRAGDTRAHYLLAASGVSTTSAARDLKAFSAQTGAAALPSSAAENEADVQSYLASLQAQSTLDLISEGLEQSKRDFDTFLEDRVQMEWDSQRKKIYEHFGLARQGGSADHSSSHMTAANASFGRSRRGNGASKGMSASRSGMSFGASGLSKSVIGNGNVSGQGRPAGFADIAENINSSSDMPGSLEGRRLREKQERFSETIRALNSSRLEQHMFPLLHQLGEVEKEFGIEDMPQIHDAYRAVIEITGELESATLVTDSSAAKERSYRDEYLDEDVTSSKNTANRKRILEGSRKFLEKQFYQQLEAAIQRNPREANMGGVPTTINKVRGYVRLRSAQKELGVDNSELQTLGDDYCWVLIFYLIRAGLIEEATGYVKENERAIRSMDRNFPQYIAAFAARSDRRLPPDIQTRINSEYQQRSRIAPENSLDPYRMACYKVIGRCDINRRSLEGTNQSMEDWVWLQFALAREVNRIEETAGDVFGLEDLKATVTDIGQKHFAQGSSDGGAGSGVFFFLQVLAGMFEQAIAYLYPHNYVSAVHFSIALDFYGLLRVSNLHSSDSDLLSFTTTQRPQLNFSRMVGYYTRDFRASKAEAATDYLTLICLNADLPGPSGRAHVELCHEALRELCLETREFAQLLGDVRPDGRKIKGAIELRLPLINLEDEEAFLRAVTRQAASTADDCGRVTDAVLLYHLAEDYDMVVTILVRTVSDAVNANLYQAPMRLEPSKPAPDGKDGSSLSLTSVDNPVDLATQITRLYESKSMYWKKISSTNRTSCLTLLRMHEIKVLTENGNWMQALDLSRELDLVPTRPGTSVAAVRAMAQNLNSRPHAVTRNIGNLLIWCINCCGKQRDHLRSGSFVEPQRENLSMELLQVAKSLMVFAGLVRYKLSESVFAMLATVGQDVGV